MTRQELDAWRARGLFVDEDFERGIAPRERFVRTALLALVVVTLAVTAAVVAMPDLGPARLQPHGFKPGSQPARIRPLWHSPLGPMTPRTPTSPTSPGPRSRANI